MPVSRLFLSLLLCREVASVSTFSPSYYPFRGNIVVEGLSGPLYDNNYYLFYHSSSFRGAGIEATYLHVLADSESPTPNTFTRANPVFACSACQGSASRCTPESCSGSWPAWWGATLDFGDGNELNVTNYGIAEDPMIFRKNANEYWLYYSSGTPGATAASDRPVRCIGLARGSGNAPEINWNSYEQPVFCTHSYNGAPSPQAASPHVFGSPDGRLFMAFGSGGGGIYGLELEAATGLPLGTNGSVPLIDSDTTSVVLLATSNEMGDVQYGDSEKKSESQSHSGYKLVMLLDSPAVLQKEIGSAMYYYLFATYGVQYRGVYSLSRVRMGRSESPLGPYVDVNNQEMVAGEATLFVDTPSGDRSKEELYENRFVGPGKVGFTTGVPDDPLAVTYRFYDAKGYGQTSGKYKCYVPVYCDSYGTLGGVLVDWDEQHWPYVRSSPWDPGNFGKDEEMPASCDTVTPRDSVAATCDDAETSLSEEDIQFLVIISVFVAVAASMYLMLEAYVKYRVRIRDADIMNPKWWEATYQEMSLARTAMPGHRMEEHEASSPFLESPNGSPGHSFPNIRKPLLSEDLQAVAELNRNTAEERGSSASGLESLSGLIERNQQGLPLPPSISVSSSSMSGGTRSTRSTPGHYASQNRSLDDLIHRSPLHSAEEVLSRRASYSPGDIILTEEVRANEEDYGNSQ